MPKTSSLPLETIGRMPARRRGGAATEIVAVALAVAAFVGLLWLARGELGMTWDEPYFFERQHDIRRWLGRLDGGRRERAAAFDRRVLERDWRFCREVPDQHPPVPSLLSLASGVVAEGWLGPLRAYRLSTVLVFAAAAGVLARFVRTRWGPWAASAAVGALVFNPRLLADAQQITADSDLGAFWFLAAASFLDTCESGRAPWRFGVFAGLAVMCKATGVLVLPATVLWAALFRPSGWWRPIAWGAALVPATMLAVNPAWWPAPVAGMSRWAGAFFAYPQKVPVYYLGKVYDSVTTFLPWHNTAVLTAVTVPAGLLALAAIGLAATAWGAIRRPPGAPDVRPDGRLPDRVVAAWAASNFLVLMVLRMFPFMPAHDGMRQLVPAFFFFPVLAAYGVHVLLGRATGRRRWAGRAFVSACLAAAAVATVHIHPYEMSYYNALIGGPRGAKAAGMESTYFWDAANDEVLAWMNAHLPEEATVLIFPGPNVLTFGWQQRWGKLRKDLQFVNADMSDPAVSWAPLLLDRPCFVIFQMRQGIYFPRPSMDSDLFVKLAESPALYELAPRRVGVRLLAIFSQQDLVRASARAVGRRAEAP